MAQHETIKAEKRDVKGTTASKRLRRTGVVPAVVYGAKQREYAIQLDSKTFADLARQHSHNFLVNLEIEGANEKSKLAIVQDIQRNPLNGALIHIDFRTVSESDTIHATVPIELQGEPIGVKSGGGLLEQLVHEIEISCRPSDLPETIVNDVESLELGQTLKVSDLNLPKGVTVKMDGDVLVAIITQTRASVSASA